MIVVDKGVTASQFVDLPKCSIERKDLTLAKPLDPSKGFTDSRTTKVLKKHDTHLIEDITSTEIQTVDDLTKVNSVNDVLLKYYS